MAANLENIADHPEQVSMEPKPLPSVSAVIWIAWFSFREMSRRRRLISLGLISLLPVLVVLAIRLWYNDVAVTPQQLLSGLSFDIFLRLLVPIIAMAVGASAIGEQVEEGTIVFSWTRPIRRRAIYLGRLLAAQLVAASLLSGSLVLCFLIMVSNGLSIITWEFLRLYLVTFLIIALGSFTYVAVFAAMGTWFRKPVLPAILYAFGWENMVTNIPARVQELSLRFHLQNLVDRPETPPEDLPGFLSALLSATFHRDPVPRWQSVLVLVAVGVVAAVVGTWLLRHKELEK